jgi:outer membrane protein OmpA-like peptidoglycan-associated protein
MNSILQTRIVQPKLTVSQADDEYEREADRVAAMVMRMTDPQSLPEVRSNSSSGLQRKCACSNEAGDCADCKATEVSSLQRTASGTGRPMDVPRIVHEVLRSPGQALDAGTRSFMEPRFNHDFSGVRVHTDNRASESATAVSALAFTVGNNIVFTSGQYAPSTLEGRRLLAHELTHVVQQGGRSTPTVQRQPAPPAKPLTRDEEVRLSFTSPGEVEFLSNPPRLSLYNFAIWNADLKEKHVAAINLLGSVINQFAAGMITPAVKGHADATGEDPINNPLSKDRSSAVEKALSSAAGVPVKPSSCGKYCPAATNATVEGRSHNRRVEISFTSKKGGGDIDWPSLCKLVPEVCLCLLNPMFCREEEEDGDGDGVDWPSLCPGTLGKVICGAILCLLAFKLCLSAFCRIFPELCLLTLCKVFPSLCKGKRKKPDQPKRRRACPTKVDLPSGKIKAYKEERVGYARVWYPFPMNIDFKNDASGCDCSCGEYKQLIRGYFEYDDTGKGAWQREQSALTFGVYLDATHFQEDAAPVGGPYGHRFWDDDTRTDPKPNNEGDEFLLTRETGCRYRGKDEPGFDYVQDYPARIRMHLEFVGGPVDVCMTPGQRTHLDEHWHTWIIDGEAQAKPPTPPKPRRKSIFSFFVRSGLPKNPKEGEKLLLDLAIEGEPDECHRRIPVRIVVVDPTLITAITENSDPVQVSPDACPNVWVRPYETVTIYR